MTNLIIDEITLSDGETYDRFRLESYHRAIEILKRKGDKASQYSSLLSVYTREDLSDDQGWKRLELVSHEQPHGFYVSNDAIPDALRLVRDGYIEALRECVRFGRPV
jgi:hypothetical protein